MVVIVDLLAISKSNSDYVMIKDICKLLQDYYPVRVDRIFFFPKNLMVDIGLNVAKVNDCI